MFKLNQAGLKSPKVVKAPWMPGENVMKIEDGYFYMSEHLCETMEIKPNSEVTLVNKEGIVYLWVTDFKRDGNKIIDSEGNSSLSTNFVRIQKSTGKYHLAMRGKNSSLAKKVEGTWTISADETGYALEPYVETIEENTLVEKIVNYRTIEN